MEPLTGTGVCATVLAQPKMPSIAWRFRNSKIPNQKSKMKSAFSQDLIATGKNKPQHDKPDDDQGQGDPF